MVFSISSCAELTFSKLSIFLLVLGWRKKKKVVAAGVPRINQRTPAHTGRACPRWKFLLSFKKPFPAIARRLERSSSKSSSFQQIVSFPTTFTHTTVPGEPPARCWVGGREKIRFSPFLTLIYWRLIFLRLLFLWDRTQKQNKYIPSAVTQLASQQPPPHSNSSAACPPTRSPEPSIRVPVWRDDIRRTCMGHCPNTTFIFSLSLSWPSHILLWVTDSETFFLCVWFDSAPPFPPLVMTSCLLKKERSDWDQPIKSWREKTPANSTVTHSCCSI